MPNPVIFSPAAIAVISAAVRADVPVVELVTLAPLELLEAVDGLVDTGFLIPPSDTYMSLAKN